MARSGNRKSQYPGQNRPTDAQCTDVRALYDCLSYLVVEAKQAELHELAHLIGVAAQSAEDAIHNLIRSVKSTH